jgi:AcrR family transcriptional regulator
MTSATNRRRRLPPNERRALIIEAAGRLFAERGFDAARLDEIAAAAGVTKPILYRHFSDKTALYLALLERHREDLGTFADAVPRKGTLEHKLRTVLETWLAYVKDHAYAWKLLFADSGGGAQIQELRNEVRARARTVLADLIDTLSEGPIPRCELEPIAELMRAGMASLALQWIEHATPPPEPLINAMLRVWISLLGEEKRREPDPALGTAKTRRDRRD